MQSSSDLGQLENFLRGLSPVFIILGDWLPRLTVIWFPKDIRQLCRRPTGTGTLALEFEPQTPRIIQIRARTHSALKPLACLLDPILRSVQYSLATARVQITNGPACLTYPERVHTACLALRPGSDRIAIDQSMPDVGNPCNPRASNAFPWAGALEHSSILAASARVRLAPARLTPSASKNM
jgi:hypothetical protein